MTTFKQFVTYAAVGLIGTIAHYIILISLVELLDIPPVIATTSGFITGALINYVLNYKYTFRSQNKHLDTFSKFITTAILGGTINSMIMYIGTLITMANYIVVQILATGIVLLLNFFINKHWTFAYKGINNSRE